MKITLTIGELSNKVNDWNYACKVLGLNPWCLNEGLASSDTEISITIEQLHKIGLQFMLTNKPQTPTTETLMWDDIEKQNRHKHYSEYD